MEQSQDFENSAPDVVEEVADYSADDEQVTGEDLPTEEPEEESEELDLDGHKLSLPKSLAEKLKNERLMHADYTRKTQEVAEQRKAAEAHQEQVLARERFIAENIREVAMLENLSSEIQQLQNIDWNSLHADDPVTAGKLSFKLNELRNAQAQLTQHLTAKEQQKQLETQQLLAKRTQEGLEVLKRDIPNWSNEIAAKIMSYAESQGISREAINRITNPTEVKLLHKAMMWDQLQKKQPTKPQVDVKPNVKIPASRSNVQKDPDKMTTEEWMKSRNSQINKKS